MKIRCVVLGFLCLPPTISPAAEVSGVIIVSPKIIRKTLPPAIYDLRAAGAGNKASPVAGQMAGTSNGFGRVAVWLESSTAEPPAPISAVMKQSDFRLEPDLLIVPAGSTVTFPNLDPVFHNVFSLSKTQSFDLGYYCQGKSRDVVFNRPGIVQVYCHIHPEMYGVIVITSSPWSARPSSDGKFAWSNVPPGTYRLAVWQKSAGLIRKPLVVSQAGVAQIKIALPEEDAGR